MSARNTSVNHFLEPLRPFLSDKAITEIVVNRPGQVYFETRAGWKAKDVPQLTYEHLIKLGHQRIGIITGPQNAESAQARYSGYANTCA